MRRKWERSSTWSPWVLDEINALAIHKLIPFVSVSRLKQRRLKIPMGLLQWAQKLVQNVLHMNGPLYTSFPNMVSYEEVTKAFFWAHLYTSMLKVPPKNFGRPTTSVRRFDEISREFLKTVTRRTNGPFLHLSRFSSLILFCQTLKSFRIYDGLRKHGHVGIRILI